MAARPATKLGQDRELFDALIDGKPVEFEQPIQLTSSALVKVRMKQGGPRFECVLCLLASLQPKHLLNNTPLDLFNGFCIRIHETGTPPHFSKCLPRETRARAADIHSLANFCFLPLN